MFTLDELNKRQDLKPLALREELMAPNGYLHAATVIALADTSCGYGTFVNLPEGAERDATVSDEKVGKPIALFRCTQMILYPR